MNSVSESNASPKSISNLWRSIWIVALFGFAGCSFQTVHHVCRWAIQTQAASQVNVVSLWAQVVLIEDEPIRSVTWLKAECARGDGRNRVEDTRPGESRGSESI
jgi:hypothetical protein